jgi:hypothetical protein
MRCAVIADLIRNPLNNRGMLKQVQHDATFNPDGLPNRTPSFRAPCWRGFASRACTKIGTSYKLAPAKSILK